MRTPRVRLWPGGTLCDRATTSMRVSVSKARWRVQPCGPYAVRVMTDGSEKRQFRRVRIPLLVQYWTSPLEEFKTDYASDISEGGIFLSEVGPLPNGTMLFLQFVTRDGMHLVSAEARVVRRTAEGNGMQFVKLDQADLTVLKELLAKVPAR